MTAPAIRLRRSVMVSTANDLPASRPFPRALTTHQPPFSISVQTGVADMLRSGHRPVGRRATATKPGGIALAGILSTRSRASAPPPERALSGRDAAMRRLADLSYRSISRSRAAAACGRGGASCATGRGGRAHQVWGATPRIFAGLYSPYCRCGRAPRATTAFRVSGARLRASSSGGMCELILPKICVGLHFVPI